MPIFDTKTATELEQGLPKSDNSLSTNYKGSAPLNASITQDSWLPGTKGLDCKLVHGDRWQEVLGSMTEHFTGSVTSNIDTNDQVTILGTRTVSVTQSDTETYYSTYTVDIWQPAMVHYHSASTSTVDGLANLAQNQPSFVWNGPANYQNFGFQWTFLGASVQIAITALNIVPTLQIAANAMNVGINGIGVDLQGAVVTQHGADLTLKEAEQKITLAYGKVKGVLLRAGGAAVQAISKVNAMISAGLGTPFR